MARPGPAHRPHRLPQPSAPAHTAQPPDSESFHRPQTAPEPTTRPVGLLTGADAAAGPKPYGHGYAEPGPGRARAARCSRRGGDSARLRAGGAPRAGAVGGQKPPCCGRRPGRAHRDGRRLRQVRGPDPDSRSGPQGRMSWTARAADCPSRISLLSESAARAEVVDGAHALRPPCSGPSPQGRMSWTRLLRGPSILLRSVGASGADVVVGAHVSSPMIRISRAGSGSAMLRGGCRRRRPCPRGRRRPRGSRAASPGPSPP